MIQDIVLRDDMTAIVGLLKDLSDNNFTLRGEGDKLHVSGPNKPEWHDAIRRNKKRLIEALQASTRSIPEPEEKLRKDMAWLLRAWTAKETPSMTLTQARLRQIDMFDRRLHQWADMENLLRDCYPEYNRCPLGKCQTQQPIICMECMR